MPNMSQDMDLNGMVLQMTASGDFGRRIVLLTRERGKITAFARGASRPHSTLLAATNPFCFGTFTVVEGQNAYTLLSARISNYFQGFREDVVGMCYGSYFLEFAAWYTQENMESSDTLNLLYISLKALLNPKIPDRLVRCIYEIRLMEINGEYPTDVVSDSSLSEAARYSFYFILTSPLKKLYSFTVSEEVLKEIETQQQRIRRRIVNHNFKSLDVLNSMFG